MNFHQTNTSLVFTFDIIETLTSAELLPTCFYSVLIFIHKVKSTAAYALGGCVREEMKQSEEKRLA
ncbi:hypothetical protein [Aneurinibacillus terranovensis]|uniref:hypothetical protein n=1 Tax=Aneurinibacillus terranovensis TaxID=278991 RepID=UPI00138AB2BB|nr:hypothetical protein [Aneurinibacillus terranovensis]